MKAESLRTRTEVIPMRFPRNEYSYVIALDLGYSSIKGVCPNSVFCIPSFVKESEGTIMGELEPNEFIYRSSKGKTFAVGDLAVASMKKGETLTESDFYDRSHYNSEEYLIQFHVGLGMALWDEPQTPSPIYVQLGLPPAYLEEDQQYLKNVVAGHHVFSLRRGSKEKSFDISLTRDQIDVMSQPMGTLYSICAPEDGNMELFFKNMNSYFGKNLLIFDGGFGTLDTFLIQAKDAKRKTSNGKLGMKSLLDRARDFLKEDYKDAFISIPAMQECLRTGKYTRFDKINLRTSSVDISPYIEKANREIRDKAFDSIKNDVMDINTLIMTGGLGEAWHPYFAQRLRGIEDLEVLLGSTSSSLPCIYSNVRGYYMGCYYRRLRAESARQARA